MITKANGIPWPDRFRAICDELETYTPRQLKGIMDRCDELIVERGAADPDDDWLLKGFLDEAKRRGVYVGRTGFQVRSDKAFGGYIGKSRKLRELLVECTRGLPPQSRLNLGKLAARCLADGMPGATFTEWLTHVELIPAAIDKAFPGYLASGLLALAMN